MHRSLAWLPLLALTAIPLDAGRLVSGPMLGYVEHREAAVIVEVVETSEVAIEFSVDGDAAPPRRIVRYSPWVSPGGTQPIRFVLTNLEPGKAYTYRVFIDGAEAERPWKLGFKTQDQFEWRRPPSDFSFLIGSCSYINDPPWDRPGKPYGGNTGIFRHMASSGADFMIWLGDALYLREADWWSVSGLWRRWSNDRSNEDLQPLAAAMSHYMIWDDHDYGPNNSSKSYPLKSEALDVFRAYTGNKTYGEAGNPGVYGTLQFQDAFFIMLDNRYYRDDANLDQELHPEKSQYGTRQIEWLRDTLAHLNEGNNKRFLRFRFICTGSQFLNRNDFPGSEDANRYKRERDEILGLIRELNIPGVIFLTGDVHYSEMRRQEGLLAYPLYEVTSSSITAGPHSGKLPEDSSRIDGTVFQDNNYCKIAISGPADDRVATVTCYNRDNVLQWTREIRATELLIPKPTE
jgi:alkaline phosphatase D